MHGLALTLQHKSLDAHVQRYIRHRGGRRRLRALHICQGPRCCCCNRTVDGIACSGRTGSEETTGVPDVGKGAERVDQSTAEAVTADAVSPQANHSICTLLKHVLAALCLEHAACSTSLLAAPLATHVHNNAKLGSVAAPVPGSRLAASLLLERCSSFALCSYCIYTAYGPYGPYRRGLKAMIGYLFRLSRFCRSPLY